MNGSRAYFSWLRLRLKGLAATLGYGIAVASCFLEAVSLTGCRNDPPSGPVHLIQRGYLWQRDWKPDVTVAFHEANEHLDGVVILGAEIVWEGTTPRALRANIPWEAIKNENKPCALAIRIAPYPGPFSDDGPQIRAIASVVTSVLKEARDHGVTISEFQLDFDCAQKKLTGYRVWLRKLVPLVHPTRFVITTLPSWLTEPEFPELAMNTDGYVLQVHSVPTTEESGQPSLCDPALARKWVRESSKLGLPFSVALPTYWCEAGYDPSGKLLDVAMDSVEPNWPPSTRRLEFAPDADEIAGLVKEWRAAPPQGMKELLWYRVPVASDTRNWRWPTLLAVMEGRKPDHRIQVVYDEINPVDFSILNVGEAEELSDLDVAVTWSGSKLTAFDGLPGWTVSAENGKAIFRSQPGSGFRLSPGGRMSLGWLRFDRKTSLKAETIWHEEFSK